MPTLSTNLLYPCLLIFSTGKKTFENMGRSIERSGDTVARALLDEGRSLAEIKSIAVNRFSKKKEILFVCDHSVLRKLFASRIEGTWKHYDGVLGAEVNGYYWFVVMLASGGVTLPWECKFELPQVLCPEDHETWLQIIQRIYADIQAHFPGTLITIVADGAFSTGNMLGWCTSKNVRAEMRMHKNTGLPQNIQRFDLEAFSFCKYLFYSEGIVVPLALRRP